MSDTDKPDTGEKAEAEPVDAEFEPAPDDSPEASGEEKASSQGAGPVKLALFIVAAAAIGGAAGFGLSRVLPGAAAPAGLEDRIAALEEAGGPDVSGLEERIGRLESVMQARDALPGRVDALANTVSELEAAMQAGGQPGAEGAGDLQALQTRLDEAFDGVRTRLETLEEAVETARSEADAARSAAQQANAALSGMSAGAGEDGAPSDQRLAALSGRIDALDEALGALQSEVRPLRDLADRVDALAQSTDAPGGEALTGLRQEVEQLDQRLSAQANRLAGLADRIDALDARPASGSSASAEPAGLAARALAFAALSETASGDQPFAVELEALARVWPRAPGLEALRGVAREGAPTADRLEDTFPAEALREATGEARTYFGVLRVARDENAGPAAAIARALAEDDLAAAADTVAALDEAGQAALGEWRSGLADRLRVRQALTQQSAALAAAGDRP
ncbi:MAG: hypothetical protein ACFE0P_09685 [Oceanicaulis sp.]